MPRALFALAAALLLFGCQKPKAVFDVKTESTPSPASLVLDGRALGSTPITIHLERLEDIAKVRARFEGQDPVEQRIRFLPGDQAELIFLFGEGRSPMAKALGLARILVFEYAAGLTFDVNKWELKAGTLPLLQRQAMLLNSGFKDIKIQVCGHTDSTGTQEQNMELSLQRAQAVLDYLAAQGVAKERLHPLGFAAAYPLATNATEEGRGLNRRTEIVLGM